MGLGSWVGRPVTVRERRFRHRWDTLMQRSVPLPLRGKVLSVGMTAATSHKGVPQGGQVFTFDFCWPTIRLTAQ